MYIAKVTIINSSDTFTKYVGHVVNADVHTCTYFLFQNGDTPLNIASFRGHEEVMKLLVSAGAKVDVTDNVS